MLLSEVFIRNYLNLKVPMEVGVSDISRCFNDVPKYLVLKSLNDVSVALFRASPQLYAVGPDRLQYLFVQHQLIVYRQGRSSSHQPIRFLLFLSKLFAFFRDMCIPAQLGIQRRAKVFRCVRVRYDFAIYSYRYMLTLNA